MLYGLSFLCSNKAFPQCFTTHKITEAYFASDVYDSHGLPSGSTVSPNYKVDNDFQKNTLIIFDLKLKTEIECLLNTQFKQYNRIQFLGPDQGTGM